MVDIMQSMRDQYEADKQLPDHGSALQSNEQGLTPYSVLLSYPDYMTDGDLETYYAHIEASSVQGAIAAAQATCMADNWDDEVGLSGIADVNDLRVLLVIAGHCHDLTLHTETETHI